MDGQMVAWKRFRGMLDLDLRLRSKGSVRKALNFPATLSARAA